MGRYVAICDGNGFVIVDTETNKEICVVNDYDGQADPPVARASTIVDALNSR